MSSSSSKSTTLNEFRIAESPDALVQELARLIVNVRSFTLALAPTAPAFHVALSGGSLPATLGKALLAAKLDISSWHWWFADERVVALSDPDSNYAESHKHIFGPLGIKKDKIHALDETKIGQPKEAAAAYEKELRQFVPDGSLDLLLLGMGPDGHTCSLFPDHPLLKEDHLWIAPITDSPKPPPTRITMTFPLIAKAKVSLFVITGSGKQDALKTVYEQREQLNAVTTESSSSTSASVDMSHFLPSARVRSKNVMYLVDKDAAGKLPALAPKL